MWGPGSNEGAYDYAPFPGTSTRLQQNLKNYDKAYKKAADKRKAEGYVVQGNSYFKKVEDASKPGGVRLVKVGSLDVDHNNEALVTPTTGVNMGTGQRTVSKTTVPPVATLDSSGSNGARGANRSTVTPAKSGGSSLSYRTAVEQGDSGVSVPSSGNAGSGGSGIDMSTGSREAPAPRNRMADASELERYRVWVGAHEGLARKVKKGSAGYDAIQQILNEKDGKPTQTYSEDIIAAADDAGRTPEEMSQIMGDGLETLITPEGSTRITPSTPETTSDPSNPQDGASPVPSNADNIRTYRMKRIASEQDDNLRQHYATRTHKDVFDESTNSWKQVPIKR